MAAKAIWPKLEKLLQKAPPDERETPCYPSYTEDAKGGYVGVVSPQVVHTNDTADFAHFVRDVAATNLKHKDGLMVEKLLRAALDDVARTAPDDWWISAPNQLQLTDALILQKKREEAATTVAALRRYLDAAKESGKAGSKAQLIEDLFRSTKVLETYLSRKDPPAR